jgi:hypothetical protein
MTLQIPPTVQVRPSSSTYHKSKHILEVREDHVICNCLLGFSNILDDSLKLVPGQLCY